MWKAGFAAALVAFAMSQAHAQETVCASPRTSVAELDEMLTGLGASMVAKTPHTPRGIWFLWQLPNGQLLDVWITPDGQGCVSQVYDKDPRKQDTAA